MKALQQRTWNAERRRLQADLDARLDELFLECPTLCGFTLHRHGSAINATSHPWLHRRKVRSKHRRVNQRFHLWYGRVVERTTWG